jgi:hypothetical protein
VRTSPDHGTGYDIAGQNKADASSMRKAIYSAIDISRNRSLNGAFKKNALKPQKMEDIRGKRFSDRRSSSRPEKKVQNKSET